MDANTLKMVCSEISAESYRLGLDIGITLAVLSLLAMFFAGYLFNNPKILSTIGIVLFKSEFGPAVLPEEYPVSTTQNESPENVNSEIDHEPNFILENPLLMPTATDSEIFSNSISANISAGVVSASQPSIVFGTTSPAIIVSPTESPADPTTADRATSGYGPVRRLKADSFGLTRQREMELLSHFNAMIMGMKLDSAKELVSKGNLYALHPIYVNNLPKRVSVERSEYIVGVRVSDPEYDLSNEAFSDKAVVVEVVDIGGQDIHNRGACTSKSNDTKKTV